ncbi:alpha/beta hydrolase-fold protein [Luteolibacter flavescens]|uniref:Alpha/beta hydrolase-fold protein n=1 Tax=Luteolibacter flavescens TaxID=1859460 RepID=A0ABT3FLD1_9BACT|nr:alpha/beta hydrolase-fold protein [Luteolibacter flavescens]MCW1884397.1 alpha/beta hydrolase-fold protein [Luteolibacter flavescens]
MMKLPTFPAILTSVLLVTAASAAEFKPYTLPGCTETVVKSAEGKEYRVMISVPEGEAPAGGHSVTYVLDGDELFPVVTSVLKMQAGTGKLSKHNGIVPGIVVGIGYPGESRRDFDYTLDAPAGPPETYRNGKPYPPRPGGGADKLLDFILKEVRPLVEKQQKVDTSRQTLMGNGYGGLFALHVLFTKPELFQTYIASSPSIWWNDRYILKEEAAFRERIAKEPVKATLVLTVGEQEQSLTRIESSWAEDEREEHRLKVTRRKMVDNTRELFWRLDQASTPEFPVSFRMFEGESHKSVIPMAVSYALPFAFPAAP